MDARTHTRDIEGLLKIRDKNSVKNMMKLTKECMNLELDQRSLRRHNYNSQVLDKSLILSQHNRR